MRSRPQRYLLLLAGGSSSASGSSGAVPVNTVAPAITGTERVGQTLTVSDGTWSNTPTSFTYQWFRAITSGGSIVTSGGLFTGNAIAAATASTYALVAADGDQLIYCEVTATNASGSTMAQSNATAAISALASPLGLLLVLTRAA